MVTMAKHEISNNWSVWMLRKRKWMQVVKHLPQYRIILIFVFLGWRYLKKEEMPFQCWRTFSHRVILETVLWTQCSSHHFDAFVMFFCLLKCDMDNCCVIINVCILYLYVLQVRLLLYLWPLRGEYMCSYSSTFITSDNYTTMYVWNIWQSLAFDHLIS